MQKIRRKKLASKWVVEYDNVLGHGAFATTYLAKNLPGEDKVFACKAIQKRRLLQRLGGGREGRGKEYLIERIQSEIRVLRQTDHPNLVKLIDFCQTQNNIYLILQLCDFDLESYLLKHTLTLATFLPLADQLLEGCLCLHSKSIEHRDLKPSNILMKDGVLKIGDFGLAKILEKGEAQLMTSGTKVGSPLYMSPQVLGEERYTIKCDMWSLGIIFYQMLFQSLPFGLTKKQGQQSIRSKLREGKLDLSGLSNPGLREIIQGMLTYDDQARWPITRVHAQFRKLL